MRERAGAGAAGEVRNVAEEPRDRNGAGLTTRRWSAIALLVAVVLGGAAVLSLVGCGGGGGPTEAGEVELWVWLDAGLFEPIPELSHVLAAVDSAAGVGATGVVLEVKTRTGEALVPSTAFPVARDILREIGGSLLGAVVEKCSQRGLQLALGDHVFYGGNVRMRRGLVFRGGADWAVVRVGRKGLLSDTDNPELTWARLCPVHPDVQKAELAFLDQLARISGIGDIWLEGVGFPDVWSGFGPVARTQFESWLEGKVKNWPDDVLVRLGRDDSLKAGHYLRQWLLWRALAMKRFLKEAANTVHRANRDVTVGVVAGGWLPRSYQQGLNWAPQSYKWTSRWLPPDYGSASCAGEMDRLGVGLFFPYIREKDAKKGMRAAAEAEGFDAGWFSVEGCVKRVAAFQELSGKVTGVVHAGIWGKDLRQLERALKAARRLGSVLVLDASALNEMHAWRVLRQN